MNYEDPAVVHEGVTVCPLHDNGPMDESCEGCNIEIAHRSKVIGDMQAEAANRARGLAQQRIPFGQAALDTIKVQIMWETMFQERQAFIAEAEMGRRAILMMKEMQSAADRANIMAPNGGLHIVQDRKKK